MLSAMNPKQRRFAEEFVIDHHGQNAAVRAGYSLKRARHTASELLRNPEVAVLVEELEDVTRSELGVTREYVAEGFRTYHELALQGQMPGSVGVRALEGLAKAAGLFVERREVEHSGEVVYTLHLDREDIGQRALEG
jgi:phage terminase small subunit